MSKLPATLAVKPPSFTALLWGMAALIVTAVAGASLLPYSKKERVGGYLQPTGGEIRILAPASGTVVLSARPGDSVSAGQVLASVKTADEMAEGGSYRQSRDDVREQQMALVENELRQSTVGLMAQQQALQSQLLLAREAAVQAEAEVATRAQQVRLARAKLERQQGLVTQGFVAAVAVEQLELDVLTQQASLQAAQRAASSQGGQVQALGAELVALANQQMVRVSQLQRELKGLAQDAAEGRRSVGLAAVAPGAARVTAAAVGDGDSVTSGQLLLKLARQDATLEVALLLPATAGGRVTPGQRVFIELAAFPYQSFGHVEAEITHVESSPLLAAETTALRGNGAAPDALVLQATARIVDVPPAIGGLAALRPGMQLKAAVEVERKSFLAWMSGPMFKHFR